VSERDRDRRNACMRGCEKEDGRESRVGITFSLFLFPDLVSIGRLLFGYVLLLHQSLFAVLLAIFLTATTTKAGSFKGLLRPNKR